MMQAHPFSPYPPPMTVHPAAPQAPNGCADIARMALTGAMIGGAVAAAVQARRARHDIVDAKDIAAAAARTAAITGVATAASGVLANLVAEQGAVRLGIMFAGTVAAYYGLDVLADKLEERR